MENTSDKAIEICNLDCKKHVKIYKLKQLGLSNKEIAGTLGTNTGHVYNALKKYDQNPELKTQADNHPTL